VNHEKKWMTLHASLVAFDAWLLGADIGVPTVNWVLLSVNVAFYLFWAVVA
jgi:hypothetical protein